MVCFTIELTKAHWTDPKQNPPVVTTTVTAVALHALAMEMDIVHVLHLHAIAIWTHGKQNPNKRLCSRAPN